MGWACVAVGPLADEAPAFVLLQLCPVIEAAFRDMHEDLLRLVKGECTALSHLFSFLLSQPPGCGSGGGTSPVWPEQQAGRAPAWDEQTGIPSSEFTSTYIGRVPHEPAGDTKKSEFKSQLYR